MKFKNLAQRERIGLGFLALLAPFAIWQYLGPALSNLANRGTGGLAPVASVESRAVARQEIAELRLWALEAGGGEYEPERNIFRFGEKAKPPPPPPPPRKPPPPPPPPRQAPPVQRAGPQPPPIDVSLLGIFGPERRRIAVLVDPEGVILNKLHGETVREKFIVHKIGYQSIELKFVGFPDVEPEQIEIGD